MVGVGLLVAAACVPPPPPGATFADTFTRADATVLGNAETGQPWQSLAGSWGVQSGQAAQRSTGYGLAVADTGGAVGTYALTVQTASPELWAVVRATDAGNYWRFGRSGGGAYTLQLIRSGSVAAVPVTTIATVTPASGDRLSCELGTTAITCSVNGVAVATTADRSNASATRHGMAAYDAVTAPAARFDGLSFIPTIPTPAPDMHVSIATTSPTVVGDQLTYTVTVANQGDAAADAVHLAHALPIQVANPVVSSTQGSCTIVITTLTSVDCALGPIAAGASATATVTVDAVQSGTAIANASVSLGTASSTPVTSASSTTTIAPEIGTPPTAVLGDTFTRADAASLGNAETGQPWSATLGAFAVADGRGTQSGQGYAIATADAGESFGDFQVTVPDTSNGFWIVFHLTDANNYWRFGSADGNKYGIQKIVNGALPQSQFMLSFNTVYPADGDVLRVRLLADDSIDAYVNDIHVAGTGDLFNIDATRFGIASYRPDTSQPAALFDDLTFTPSAAAGPALHVAFGSTPPVSVGDRFSYGLTVTNQGAGAAADVELVQTLPSQVAYVSAAASQGSCSESAGTVTCVLGAVAPGANVTASVTVDAVQAGDAVSTASVRIGATGTPHHTVSTTTTVATPPDPTVGLADTFSRADAGSLGVAESGQAWFGLRGSWGVSNGQAAQTSTGYGVAVADAAAAQGTLAVTVPVASTEFWAVVRATDSGNYWRFGRSAGGAYTLQLIRNNAIAAVPISTTGAGASPADGDQLSCELRADGLSCSVNGVLVASTTDTSNAAATRHGVAAYDAVAAPAARFDDIVFTPTTTP